jgi:FAD/FMN-containing dehydrogenase
MSWFFAGDEGYDSEIAGFQTAFRHRPSAVVAAESADDVAEAVTYAGARGLKVAVQATGHGALAPADGVLVSTRRMAGVRIDPVARTAWVEAGARWAAVIEQAAVYGLAPLSGSSPGVGAVGYTVGGGIGLLGRQFGYTADHVTALDVVTADGRRRHVTAASEPDLFWALRGGRDLLGIVTGLEVALVPMTVVHGGGLYFDAAHATAVLSAFRELTAPEAAPETLTASVGMVGLPTVAAIEEPLRGKHVLHVRLASTVPVDPALLDVLRAAGPRLVDRVGPVPVPDVGSIYGEPDFPHAYVGDNVLLDALPQELLDTVFTLAGPAAAVPCVVDLRHLGGAMAREPAVPNAVPYREATHILRVLSPVGDLDAVRPVHRAVFAAAAPFTIGRAATFRYGPPDQDSALPAPYDPATWSRLSQLRSNLDPEGRFLSVVDANMCS